MRGSKVGTMAVAALLALGGAQAVPAEAGGALDCGIPPGAEACPRYETRYDG